jgi:adenylate cyclase
MARDQRRLAAIVSADVAGYSRLMGRDESDTLARLKAHRHDLIDPKIAEFGGRIVKTTGDGLLLEFPSVVDAVRCAVDVQRGVAERNADVAAGERIEFRIGINVGDIIIDDDDIYGDGVNVAARLQALAQPGGICVSRVVRDQVLDKLSFVFEDLGAQEVKNIARPIEVFRVDLATEGMPATKRDHRRWRQLTTGSRLLFTGGLVAVGIAALAVGTLSERWKVADPAARPSRYSVAILPFAAAAATPADEEFAEVLTNDLTIAVGLGHVIPVVSHSVAVAYKGKAIDARAIGRELNVRYLVQGDVRRAGERIIVNAQLVDTGTATQLWTDHLEVDPTQPTNDTPDLVALLTRRVRNALGNEESRRASAPLPPGATAMDLASHAEAVNSRATCAAPGDCIQVALEARQLFDQALRLDPQLVLAMTGRADTLNDELWLNLHADHDRLVRELDDVTNRAVATDASDPAAWWARGVALLWQWRWPAALEATTKSSSLNPTWPSPLVQRAWIMVHTGQPAEALRWLDKAFAVDPNAAGLQILMRCRAYQALGRYDDAIAAGEKAVVGQDYWIPHAYLVAAYALKGEAAKAKAEKTILLKQQPGMTIAALKAMRLSNDPNYLEQTEAHIYAGLRKAGIPDQ